MLAEAALAYPQIRILDWAAIVETEWFLPDGIHYTSDGYFKRAGMIADALVSEIPAER